jgi:hypothetical protein
MRAILVARAATLREDHAPSMARLSLDIDFAASPMEGTLREENGDEHRFVDWLGLAEVLGRIGDGERASRDSSSEDESDRVSEESSHASADDAA